jgi:deoxyribodipyrimidine photo-lyase
VVRTCRRGDVLPLFVLDPTLTGISPNRHRFLLETLADLDGELARRAGRLFVRSGDRAAQAVALAVEAGCDTIHVTADVGAIAGRRERDLADRCRDAGLTLQIFPGNAVVEPGEVVPAGRDVYSVITP